MLGFERPRSNGSPERNFPVKRMPSLLRCAPLLAWLALVTPLPSLAGMSAPESLKTFRVDSAFQIEQVAAEPAVIDPVDLEFDEHGAAYVLEMGGYPIASEKPEEYPGKIVRLEDMNNDGIYERSTLFADKFRYACSIMPWRGGLLVASPPDILFVKDNDGDGLAEERRVILTGFAVGNTQHNFNGLIYGLDNWIYAENGGNSGAPYWPDNPKEKLNIRWRDFRFDPEKKRFEGVSTTSGGFGYAFDDWGRIFTTHNTEHVNHAVFPMRYFDGNPYLADRRTITDISDHSDGIGARIFPIGVQETRVNHPEQSGYFSGACGIAFYGGGSFPTGYNGNLFVCDVVLNLVHRDVLHPDGPAFKASRGDERVEFLASSDRASRPVNLTTGPDGALYVVDLYRDVIEHPEWIPDELEKDMDVRAGADKGRIYRITPKGGLPKAEVHIDREHLREVIALLGHKNKWWRDNAQRLLVEWSAPKSVPLLNEFFNGSKNPLARLHAMWTLKGLNQLDPEVLIEALRDPEPGLRENALQAAEDRLMASPALLDAALRLAKDPDPRVRMQAALSLGTVTAESAAGKIQEAFIRILDRDVESRWTQRAILAGSGSNPRPVLRSVLEGEPTEARQAMIHSLTQIVGARARTGEIETVLKEIAATLAQTDRKAVAALDGLAEGLGEDKADKSSDTKGITAALTPFIQSDSISELRAAWRVQRAFKIEPNSKQKKALNAAAKAVTDEKAPLESRLANLDLLEFEDFDRRGKVLFDLLNPRLPPEIQAAAIKQLGRGPNDEVASHLIEIWNSLGPETRGPASDMLIFRKPNHDRLLTALEKKDILIGQLNMDLERRRALLFSHDPEIKRRASALFNDFNVVTRGEALEKMRPALKLTGDPERGHKQFQNLCMKCHQLGGEGHLVGANLTDIGRKSAETLLHDIVDPNAAVPTQYISTTIVTKDGQIHNGIIGSESAASVTLREADEKETVIQRENITELRATGLSLMPEELETGLTQQDMADLLSFLQQPR